MFFIYSSHVSNFVSDIFRILDFQNQPALCCLINVLHDLHVSVFFFSILDFQNKEMEFTKVLYTVDHLIRFHVK